MRDGRSSAAISDLEVRPEMEFRHEPEIGNQAEIGFPCPPSVKGIWASKPSEIAETVSK